MAKKKSLKQRIEEGVQKRLTEMEEEEEEAEEKRRIILQKLEEYSALTKMYETFVERSAEIFAEVVFKGYSTRPLKDYFSQLESEFWQMNWADLTRRALENLSTLGLAEYVNTKYCEHGSYLRYRLTEKGYELARMVTFGRELATSHDTDHEFEVYLHRTKGGEVRV